MTKRTRKGITIGTLTGAVGLLVAVGFKPDVPAGGRALIDAASTRDVASLDTSLQKLVDMQRVFAKGLCLQLTPNDAAKIGLPCRDLMGPDWYWDRDDFRP